MIEMPAEFLPGAGLDDPNQAPTRGQRLSAKAYATSRKADHKRAQAIETAWRAAGRPIIRVSDDRLTSELIYLDAEDVMQGIER